MTVIPPCPLAQPNRALVGFGVSAEAIDGPWEAERPVLLGDGRGLVDAIAPAEGVLNRQQQQIGSRREQRLEQDVANLGRVGDRRDVAAAGEALDERQLRHFCPLVLRRVLPPWEERL